MSFLYLKDVFLLAKKVGKNNLTKTSENELFKGRMEKISFCKL